MRAVAVLLVILSHAGVSALAGGFVGVDVFFVLSGFLITGILVRQVEHDGAVGIGRFYANRAKRILPAAAIVLVTTLVLARHALPYARAMSEVRSALWSTFFAANWHFGFANTDYFAQDQPASAVQHFWSLAVEEQFYVIWPLLIVVAFLGVRSRARLGAILGVVTSVSLLWSVVQTSTNPEFAYFSTFTRAWELGAGGLLAVYVVHARRLSDRVKALLSWAGLVAVVLGAVVYTDLTPFPGHAALLPVLGTVAILAGGVDGPRYGAERLLGVAPLTWVGDISYSLYLWHWPMLILAPAMVGHALTTSQNLLLMVGAVGLSAGTYYLVENPIRRYAGFRSRPLRGLVLWPATILVLVAASLWVRTDLRSAHESEQLTADQAFDAGVAKIARRSATPLSPVQTAVAAARARLPVPTFAPSLDDLSDDDDYTDCFDDIGEFSKDVCELGDPDGTKRIVVLGDSTQAMWLPAMRQAARERHWSLKTIIKYECPGFEELHLRGPAPMSECTDWRAWAVDEVDRLEPDLVLVGGYTSLHQVLDSSGSRVKDTSSAAAIWEKGVTSTLSDLAAPGRRVVAIAMQPTARTQPLDCLGVASKTLRDCSYPDDDPISRKVNAAQQAAADATGASVVSWKDWTCYDGLCPMVVDKIATLRDNHHLSATYSASLSEKMAASLAGLVG